MEAYYWQLFVLNDFEKVGIITKVKIETINAITLKSIIQLEIGVVMMLKSRVMVLQEIMKKNEVMLMTIQMKMNQNEEMCENLILIEIESIYGGSGGGYQGGSEIVCYGGCGGGQDGGYGIGEDLIDDYIEGICQGGGLKGGKGGGIGSELNDIIGGGLYRGIGIGEYKDGDETD
ncbi:MAG: hypothetical protein EZS28_032688 [Streblomastix strix]|uniref:Uncharacterized protein n=1 Tax=Streblomastix strix TaxID=222440 RepID=A0A5J4UNQ7_9EUKA|nr:MAG: hypothetical protein EZS28_032688 [Streblomastix strix]